MDSWTRNNYGLVDWDFKGSIVTQDGNGHKEKSCIAGVNGGIETLGHRLGDCYKALLGINGNSSFTEVKLINTICNLVSALVSQ